MQFEYTFDIKKLKMSPELSAMFMEKNVQENFAGLFENFLKSVYPQVSGSKLRCMTRIMNKLDIAVAEEKNEIELDASEKRFLEELFKDDSLNIRQEFYRVYSVYAEKFL